jgi:hypothetical protein
MQPSWTSDENLPPEVAAALVAQCASLLQRIVTIERALNVREWWLLGRAVPEAGQVAEVASLLAVAHGELEGALAEHFNWRTPALDEDAPDEDGDGEPVSSDPVWVRARQEESSGLLRMLRKALPNMWLFAEQLRANAEEALLPPTALSALGIVQDRLGEAIEALGQPDN